MIERKIFCLNCGEHSTFANLTNHERAAGIHMRKVSIVGIMPPKSHGYTMNGHFTARGLACDGCNRQIQKGSSAIAVTRWNPLGHPKDAEPPMWERTFGEVFSL